VPASSWPGPRASVEALVRDIGAEGHVRACLGLLNGDDVDGHIVHALGGPPARWAMDGSASGPDYWLRVWALRGLLWHWDARASAAVVEALGDDSWRVREMACKVLARHLVGEAVEPLIRLQHDEVSRVRAAAHRAVERLVSRGE